jgi:hypothetical protein
MKVLNAPRLASPCVLFLGLLLLLVLPNTVTAQQLNAHRKTFIGPYDSEYSEPVAEGKIGEKDAAAMAEIKQSVAAVALPEREGIDAHGLLTSGSAKSEQQFPASIAIENDGRFRMDVQKPGGVFSIRLIGHDGRARRETGVTDTLNDIDFGNPLSMPSQLLEIANRKDAAVVDDGLVVIGDYRMHKVTVTLFHPQLGDPVAASFYFDSVNHLLQKSALVNHSATSSSLKYLRVVTYGSYGMEKAVMFPHEYSETVNGQLIMTLKITSANLTSRRNDSYFTF